MGYGFCHDLMALKHSCHVDIANFKKSSIKKKKRKTENSSGLMSIYARITLDRKKKLESNGQMSNNTAGMQHFIIMNLNKNMSHDYLLLWPLMKLQTLRDLNNITCSSPVRSVRTLDCHTYSAQIFMTAKTVYANIENNTLIQTEMPCIQQKNENHDSYL